MANKPKPYRKLAASTRKSLRSENQGLSGNATSKGYKKMVESVGERKAVNDLAKKPTGEMKTGFRDLNGKTTRLHEFGVGNSSRPIAGFRKKNG